MTAAPYGDKGCRCWRSEDYNPWDDRTHHEWMPNASCPHHGLLAGLARDRMETGTYRVDLSTPPDGPECPPGVHSMFDPCPGGCLNDDDEIDEKEAAEEEAEVEHAPNPCPEGECLGNWNCPRECPPPRPGSPEWFAEERARRDAEASICRVHCPSPAAPCADGGVPGCPCDCLPAIERDRRHPYVDDEEVAMLEPQLLGKGYRTTTEKERGVLATVRRWLNPGYWIWEWERPWRR